MNKAENVRRKDWWWLRLLILCVLVIGSVVPLVAALNNSDTHPAGGGTAYQVSTGETSACAVVDFKAYCWGDSTYGKLGTGKTYSGNYQSRPVAVDASKFNGSVNMVSVGKTHACALVNANAYCWGDNRRGQLGNKSTTSSSAPVAIDVSDGSALRGKEIVDISAGEYFTCALGSDGTVACWGEGDNGRLGLGGTADKNRPTAVNLSGKKGISLARISGSAMCVLAANNLSTSASGTGYPFCWGRGMGYQQSVPSNSMTRLYPVTTTSCATPPSSENTVYSDALSPVQYSDSQMFSSVDIPTNGDDTYATGLATNKRAYYWGNNGYTTQSGWHGACSPVGSGGGDVHAGGSQNGQPCSGGNSAGPGCGGGPTQYTKSGCTVSKTVRFGSPTPVGPLYDSASGVAGSGGGTGSTGSSSSGSGSSTGSGRGSSSASGNPLTAIDDFCNSVCPTSPSSGQTGSTGSTGGSRRDAQATVNCGAAGTSRLPEGPANGLYQKPLSLSSGGVISLFCATTSSGAYCDTHGGDPSSGQTGSNNAEHCTTTYFLGVPTGSKCDSGVTGPQQVYTGGWLAGKSIGMLDTGDSGYTCAVAGSSIGCWGVNNRGQLGTGDTTSRNVPTVVTF